MSFLDDDEDVVSEEDEDDIGFDENTFRATAHSETDTRLLDSLGAAHRTISTFTSDEFILEAYTAATTMRNMLGDSDGLAAELAETVRTNLRVCSVGIKNQPVEFVIAALKAGGATDEEQIAALIDIIENLTQYMNALAE